MNVEKLKECKIDYDMGLYRFMNNISLYEGLLKEFVKRNDYNFAENAYERQDYNEMFRILHSMQGVTGNLGMYALSNVTGELLEVLRQEDYPMIDALVSTVQKEYQIVMDGIKSAMD